MELHTIGIDLGKTVFHLLGVNLGGEVVVRKQFRANNYYTSWPIARFIWLVWRLVEARISWVGRCRSKGRDSLLVFYPSLPPRKSAFNVSMRATLHTFHPTAGAALALTSPRPVPGHCPDCRHNRSISAHSQGSRSLRASLRILVRRFESRSRQEREKPSGRERRNISSTC